MSYPKKGTFGIKFVNGKIKDGKSQCTDTHIFMTRQLIKKIILDMVEIQNFLDTNLKSKDKIEKGLEKFNNERLKLDLYAPNHTYDVNTLKALKECKINNIIDGCGPMPYSREGLHFFPQLFHKVILLPFGIQCTQIHLNYWKENEFNSFEDFIKKNNKKLLLLMMQF